VKKTTKAPSRGEGLSEQNRSFARVVAAFAGEQAVTRGGKGFGSAGLKVNGKLFAFVSSKGRFVVKLPKDRVDAIVSAGEGEYFDPGHGRLMKEWVAIDGRPADWLRLARAAHHFVGLGKA
jgi:hypothetical protein